MIRFNADMTHNEYRALVRIYEEYQRGCRKFGAFNSEYEAYGVIMEEFNEFWRIVQNHDKAWGGRDNMKSELQSVGSMAMRYIVDMGHTTDEEKVLGEFFREYKNPKSRYPKSNSEHEAYAVILAELDGFWKALKESKCSTENRMPKIDKMMSVGGLVLAFLIEM